MPSHVLSLLVENKPGLLTRVAGLFARRGFNIESLAVGVTEIPGLSRITVVVDVEELPTHGGSLRTWSVPEETAGSPSAAVARVLAEEEARLHAGGAA